MSPYFLCYKCSKVLTCQKDATKCQSCSSSNGRILTDEEFNKQYDNGAIYMINPSTGKPLKKKK